MEEHNSKAMIEERKLNIFVDNLSKKKKKRRTIIIKTVGSVEMDS